MEGTRKSDSRKLMIVKNLVDETDMTTSLRNYEAYQEYLGSLNSHQELHAQLQRSLHARTGHITDPVHGLIDVDTRLFCIIDTPEFQRLRRIHQLGVCFMVWPSASHTRFSHCIGTYHIARILLEQIYRKQRLPNLNERLIFVITTAALVHDIGHGPFSHLFEQVLHILFHGQDIPHHEEMGGRILDAMWRKYEAVRCEYSEDDLELIKALMEPGLPKHSELKKKYTAKGLGWIFKILSGPIDVDKLDYLCRDGFYSGFEYGSSLSYNLQRILAHVRVINNQLAFDERIMENIMEVLRTRWRFHKQLYKHKRVLAVEILVMEALVEYFLAKGVGNVVEVDYYVTLDDSILGENRRSTDHFFAKARQLLRRIDHRQQPGLIWSCKSMPNLRALKIKYHTEEDFAGALGEYCKDRLVKLGVVSVPFEETDVFVRWGNWSLGSVPGCSNKHPLSAISFYDPCFPMLVKQLENPHEVCGLVGLGTRHVEYWVKIYTRFSEQKDILRPMVQDFVRNCGVFKDLSDQCM